MSPLTIDPPLAGVDLPLPGWLGPPRAVFYLQYSFRVFFQVTLLSPGEVGGPRLACPASGHGPDMTPRVSSQNSSSGSSLEGG